MGLLVFDKKSVIHLHGTAHTFVLAKCPPSSHLTFVLLAVLFTISTTVDLWMNIITIHCCCSLSIHHPFAETYLGI